MDKDFILEPKTQPSQFKLTQILAEDDLSDLNNYFFSLYKLIEHIFTGKE